ncbi:MAG: 2-heptaprenyl-1,4-naphthoquinone methyltransferase [Chloroflexi bacterium]|nr:2-heptaprenyl-1,4-naphthoquinone methyltransferase [Chloroflexota bacterium]MDL1942857.1 methyltransferase domain-containing protein [Chloroflexi bacterium CFX2]
MDAAIARVNRSKEDARTSYNRLSRWYDTIAGSTEKKYRDMGLQKLSAQPGETILEIGFGTGHCLVSLAQAVGPAGRVIGLDISDGMLAVARDRLQKAGLDGRVDLRLGDAARLEFVEAGSLDGVFMSFTLELFDNPEIPLVLQECRRVLKPGGRIAVVSMTKTEPPGVAVRIYEWFHETMPNYADCRPIFARRAMEQNGFAIQDVSVSSMWGLPVEIVLGKKA